MQRLFLAVLFCMAVQFAWHDARASKRVALVIGNAAYEKTSALKNPGNDASAFSSVLEKLGFQVIKGVDLKRSAFEAKAREFALAARGAEVALFFYAGHGLQVHGRNYLVPTDAQLADEADLDFQTVSLDTILRNMEREQRTNLVFLDACRDNPLARNLSRSMGTRSSAIGRGLAKVEGGIGTLIAFATQPGNVALDGRENNSPFTTALLRHIEKPGLDIAQLMRRVRKDVIDQTSNRQVPWSNSSLTGDFYFAGRITIGPAKPQPKNDELSALQKRLKELEERLEKQAAPEPKSTPKPKSRDETDVAVGVFPYREEPSTTPKIKPGDIFRDCDDCPQMVVVPAGKLNRGEEEKKSDIWSTWNSPPNTVTFARPFALATFELTLGEFEAFVKDTGRSPGPCKVVVPTDNPFQPYKYVAKARYTYSSPGFNQTKKHPVVCVDWNDAKAFVDWLSDKTGKRYRLPSEAEWEYAARAGTKTKYWWGNSPSKSRSKYGGLTFKDGKVIATEGGPTVPVDRFRPNPWGLYNTSGNVGEWLEDCWNKSYHGAPSDGSAWTTGECNIRTMRGRYYFSSDEGQNLLRRGFYGTDYRFPILGFRVARDLTPEELGRSNGK